MAGDGGAIDIGLQAVADFFEMDGWRAIQLGADVVVYSLTKFINGTSDIIAGAICGTTEFMQSLMDLHMGSLMLLGPTMEPKAAFNISMRLPHLGLRMVAVGLLYNEGYFQQSIDHEGWQNEHYPPSELENLPLRAARDQHGDRNARGH